SLRRGAVLAGALNVNRTNFLWMMVLSIALGGCARYERTPLDVRGYAQTWSNRDVAAPAVSEFARLLSSKASAEVQAFDVADGVSLAEAEAIALFYNPQLRALRLNADISRASVEHAGLWEDPVLGIDAQRVIESVAKPWDIAASLSLTI